MPTPHTHLELTIKLTIPSKEANILGLLDEYTAKGWAPDLVRTRAVAKPMTDAPEKYARAGDL